MLYNIKPSFGGQESHEIAFAALLKKRSMRFVVSHQTLMPFRGVVMSDQTLVPFT